MRIFSTNARFTCSSLVVAIIIATSGSVHAQESVDALLPPANQSNAALDAAFGLANLLDSASNGVSHEAHISALKAGAEAGQPLALWELARMYETGEGVEIDLGQAYSYYSRIADQNATISPRSFEADIVAQSFVKLGEFYRDGLNDIGLQPDPREAHALYMHAASYFGNAEAQYRIGMLYLDENELGVNPLQSARWLSLSARKGHVSAQAALGNLLYNGEGVPQQKSEGLIWLSIAQARAAGAPEQVWINEMANDALASATPEQRLQAEEAIQLYLQSGNGS